MKDNPSETNLYLKYQHAINDIFARNSRIEVLRKAIAEATAISNKYKWLFEGIVLFLQYRYQESVEAFKQSISCSPKFALAHNGLGTAYQKLGQIDLAIQSYRKAIDLGPKDDLTPNDVIPYTNLANTFIQNSNIDDAIDALELSSSLFKDNFRVYAVYGILHLTTENYDAAIENLKRAIELEPEYPNTYRDLALAVYYSSSMSSWKEHFETAIKKDQSDPTTYFLYGKLLLENDDWEEALDKLNFAYGIYKKERLIYYQSVVNILISKTKQKIKEQRQLLKYKPDRDPLAAIIKETIDTEIEAKVNESKKKFVQFISKKFSGSSKSNILKILRRWNSFTPIVAENHKVSKGGGYFLKVRECGIVLDPGFNFIDNFRQEGHLFDEISYIFISHAHNDHTSDLESILTLLHLYNEEMLGLKNLLNPTSFVALYAKSQGVDINSVDHDKARDEFNKSDMCKKIEIYLTKSTFKKYSGMFDLYSDKYYKLHVVEAGQPKITLGAYGEVYVTSAEHSDIISDRDAVGYTFIVGRTALIYTGDTGWSSKVEESYKFISEKLKKSKIELIVLLAHLGGFGSNEGKYLVGGQDCFYRSHLGRLGIAKMCQLLQPQVCLISEFGEELKDFRVELTAIFNSAFLSRVHFVPCDIGMTMNLENGNIKAITSVDAKSLKICEDYSLFEDVYARLFYEDYSLIYCSKTAKLDHAHLFYVVTKKHIQ